MFQNVSPVLSRLKVMRLQFQAFKIQNTFQTLKTPHLNPSVFNDFQHLSEPWRVTLWWRVYSHRHVRQEFCQQTGVSSSWRTKVLQSHKVILILLEGALITLNMNPDPLFISESMLPGSIHICRWLDLIKNQLSLDQQWHARCKLSNYKSIPLNH